MSGDGKSDVVSGFELLAKNIEPSLFEYTSVSRCQADIEAYLGQYISTFTTVLPGAFARNTMVSPLNESVVDMLVLFNQKHRSEFRPADLLKKLDLTLRAKYPGTLFDEKTESVYVPIENFEFRVQPGFITDEHHYLIPAVGWNDWVEYDSIGYKNQFGRANSEHQGKLVHVVRMIKTWNRLCGNIFNGYFLELLVKDVLTGYEIQTYPAAISYIFRAILADVALRKHDPANLSLQVEGLSELEELIHAMIHVKSSYMVTLQALKSEEEGCMEAAISNWEKLFPQCVCMPQA